MILMPLSRKLMTLFVVLFLGFASFASPSPAAALSAADFINKTSAWAQAEERAHGVPASVAIAQSMLESGMGESLLTKNAHSWFGIKCSSATSPHQTGCYPIKTTEYDANGNPYTTTAQFRKYANPEKSFIDHGYFLSRLSRYRRAFDFTSNPDRFIFEVHMGGYATDPQYANKVINLMRSYNLYRYNVTAPSSGQSELVIRPQPRVNVGSTAYVTGLLSPGGGGRSVSTQALTPTGWSTSQRATSGTRGEFSLPLTYGTSTVGVTRFRVQAATDRGVVTTSEFSVERLGSLRSSAVDNVFVGQAARLRGSASGYAGRATTAQVLVNGTWRNHASGVVTRNGTFDLPLTYGQSAASTSTFRVVLTTTAGTVLTSNSVTATWVQPVSVTAYSANVKAVGQDTNAWGTAKGAPNSEVWTEVKLGSNWSRSQIATTDGQGKFVIPLTYGRDAASTFTWRVGVRSPLGNYYSAPFTLQRVPAPTVNASSSGDKFIGQDTNAWGVAKGAANSQVWTEIRLGGKWARSQVRQTNGEGRFVIPLTYGARDVGEQTWRVGVGNSLGTFHSDEFTLQRTPAPVTVNASSAGVKVVRQGTNTWGVAQGAPRAEVWTEVAIGSGWSRSQVSATDRNGRFVIPLTYGINETGTHRWRVGTRTDDGVFYSNEFNLRRVNG